MKVHSRSALVNPLSSSCPAIEQLPLTLHRQFTLMRELDQQAKGNFELVYSKSNLNTVVL